MAVLIAITFLIILYPRLVQLSICEKKETCAECITSDPSCFWCKQKNYDQIRCGTEDYLLKKKCTLIEYSHETVKIVTDRELSHVIVANENETVQVKPQRILLKLKPKSSRRIKLKYRQTVDYPVDLYYLMDLSRTMLDHKKKLAKLGNELAIQMRLITKNFRLGFGSFVDKTILPFADSNPARIKKPCPVCAPVYGFKNHMSLSTNTSQFSKEVEENSISGNIDGPEGGFEAIMQAIMCKKEIGWRKDARHLLIYASDASYHLAGDGKLGGLLKPNDAQCHLDSNGYYTHGNKQDYPSISQINLAAQANNVHIIFAVFGSKIEDYRRLSKRIKSSSTAQLTSNSSNIVEIIKNEYQKITSSIELIDNRTDFIQISYYSSCFEKNNQLKKTNICSGLQLETQVEFEIDVEVSFCPADFSKHNQTIKINPIGLRDGLIIDFEIICKCNCELDWVKKFASQTCNSKGTYQCGTCSCNVGSFGKTCECDSKDSHLIKDNRQCFRNQNDTQPCLGRGNCICNQCVCHSFRNEIQYSGEFCQCEDYSCPLFEGQLCGGKSRGTCKCGKCECNQNFKGSKCECPLSHETCFDPNTLTVCNNKGICECGKCICNDSSYTGRYCQQCPTCLSDCSTFAKIIKNQVDHEIKFISQFENFTSHLTEDDLIINEDEKICQILDQNECIYNFKYGYSKSKQESPIIIKVLKKKRCKEPINVKKYVLTYAVSFMIIGLIALSLWKLVVFFIDKREYQIFIQSCKNVNWTADENPIFKPSTSTFYNPTYSQSKK